MFNQLFCALILVFCSTVLCKKLIELKNVSNSSIEVSCETCSEQPYSRFSLKIVHDQIYSNKTVLSNLSIDNLFNLTLNYLLPGSNYTIALFGLDQHFVENIIEVTKFTTRPNPPIGSDSTILAKEDEILINWNSPGQHLIGLTDNFENLADYREINESNYSTNITGLTPGKGYTLVILNYVIDYNSSILTSEPLFKHFTSKPHPPTNLRIDQKYLSSYRVGIRWDPPDYYTQYDNYLLNYEFDGQIFSRRIPKSEETFALITKSIYPGLTYEFNIVTESRNDLTGQTVQSESSYFTVFWVTVPPLPVTNIKTYSRGKGGIHVEWSDNEQSTQDSYAFSYTDIDNQVNFTGQTKQTFFDIHDVYPGNTLNIYVSALSNNIASKTIIVKHKIPENSNRFIILISTLTITCTLSICTTILFLYLQNKPIEQDKTDLEMTHLSTELIANNYIEVKHQLSIDDSIRIDRNDLEINLHAKIGQGQFGSVYHGYLLLKNAKLSTREPVAIKVSNQLTNINEFLEEALIMKYFEHKNVLSLIGVSLEDNGSPLVVLPLMTNKDLLTYIRNEDNQTTVKQLINFAIDVANGMDYLSSQHFIHRDLAARNCMLDKDLNVRVADFGLSRHLIETDSYVYVSENSMQLMPIKWMSIESIEDRIYNTKTDVWSYGVLLWEILTRGETPYQSVNNKVLLMHLKEGGRLPQPLYCPNEIFEIQMKCWDVCPEYRPTFNELSTELKNIIKVLENEFKEKQMKRIDCNIYYNCSS